MVTLRSLNIGKSVHLLPIYTPKYRLIFPGENKKKPKTWLVCIFMFKTKSGCLGWLMDRNSNFYSPKIIWGLCEDLPDSVGLVTVQSRGTIISYLLLLCITFFFFRIRNTACVVNISQNGYSKIKTNTKTNTKPKQNHTV